jgi:surface carbohydrate biosynthesis protein
MKRAWLYLPIETKVREFHGKILLASFAAMNGFNVVIGSKKDINSIVYFAPKGIVFSFGLAKNFSKSLIKLKKYGHKTVSIDEEGLVTLKDEFYLRYRVSKEALKNTDLFFCWGKKQASLVRKKAINTNCKIFITGNPRFDILRNEYRHIFDEDAKKIKRKYGKFILINTNFGYANHFSGNDYFIKSLKEKGWMKTAEDRKYYFRRIEWQKGIYESFKKLIPVLSKN